MSTPFDDAPQPPSPDHPLPLGKDCIGLTKHLNFCLGAAIELIWHARLNEHAITDLLNAHWFINQEIGRLQHELAKDAIDRR